MKLERQYSFKSSVIATPVSGLIFKTVQAVNSPLGPNDNGYLIATTNDSNTKDAAFNHWNKELYKGFPLLYSDREIPFKDIYSAVGVDEASEYLNSSKWPTTITQEQYQNLFDLTQAKFIEYTDIQKKHIGKYAVVLNHEFWNRDKVQNSLFAELCMLFESPITFDDVFFDSVESAVTGGILLIEFASGWQAGTETLYHYRKFIEDDLIALDIDTAAFKNELVVFDMVYANTRGYDALNSNCMLAFLTEYAAPIESIKCALEEIPVKPFNIIKIEVSC